MSHVLTIIVPLKYHLPENAEADHHDSTKYCRLLLIRQNGIIQMKEY